MPGIMQQLYPPFDPQWGGMGMSGQFGTVAGANRQRSNQLYGGALSGRNMPMSGLGMPVAGAAAAYRAVQQPTMQQGGQQFLNDLRSYVGMMRSRDPGRFGSSVVQRLAPNQYAAMNSPSGAPAGVQQAAGPGPATPGGYVPFSGYQNPQAMAASQYQGAVPGVGTSYGGVQRPMWMQPEAVGQVDRSIRNPMAADMAIRRNPMLSPTASGMGLMGSSNPDFAGPNAEQLAANRAAYNARRAQALDSRQAGVLANAQARADQRRVRQGNLTMEERMQAGIPGYAVAQQAANAQKEIAQGQLGLGKEQIAANERMVGEQNKLQLAISQGNWEQAAKSQEKLLAAQQEIAKGQNQTALGVAGMNTEAQVRSAESRDKLVTGELGLKTRQADREDMQTFQRQGDHYQGLAEQARQQKNFTKYQEYQSRANENYARADALAPRGQGQAGLPAPPTANSPIGGRVTASSIFPDYQERLAIQQAGPEALIGQLRAMTGPDGQPLSQADQDAIIKELFPDTTVSTYNPNGFGLTDVIGSATGMENWNRFGRFATGNRTQGPSVFGLPVPVVPGALGVIQSYMGY